MLLDRSPDLPVAPTGVQGESMSVPQWVNFVLHGWLDMAGESILDMAAPSHVAGPPVPMPVAASSSGNGSSAGATPVLTWQSLLGVCLPGDDQPGALTGTELLSEGGHGSLESRVGGAVRSWGMGLHLGAPLAVDRRGEMKGKKKVRWMRSRPP